MGVAWSGCGRECQYVCGSVCVCVEEGGEAGGWVRGVSVCVWGG